MRKVDLHLPLPGMLNANHLDEDESVCVMLKEEKNKTLSTILHVTHYLYIKWTETKEREIIYPFTDWLLTGVYTNQSAFSIQAAHARPVCQLCHGVSQDVLHEGNSEDCNSPRRHLSTSQCSREGRGASPSPLRRWVTLGLAKGRCVSRSKCMSHLPVAV